MSSRTLPGVPQEAGSRTRRRRRASSRAASHLRAACPPRRRRRAGSRRRRPRFSRPARRSAPSPSRSPRGRRIRVRDLILEVARERDEILERLLDRPAVVLVRRAGDRPALREQRRPGERIPLERRAVVDLARMIGLVSVAVREDDELPVPRPRDGDAERRAVDLAGHVEWASPVAPRPRSARRRAHMRRRSMRVPAIRASWFPSLVAEPVRATEVSGCSFPTAPSVKQRPASARRR